MTKPLCCQQNFGMENPSHRQLQNNRLKVLLQETNMNKFISPLFALPLCIMAVLLPPCLHAALAQDQSSSPLQLTAQNTVIVSGDQGASQTLQFYLTKYYVDDAAAEAYSAKEDAVDRATSLYFPLLKDAADVTVPEGKYILAVGTTHFLSDEDKVLLQENPDAVLLRRHDNVVIIAGGIPGVSEFLNRVCGIRFYAPDEIWTSLPTSKTITIGDLDFFRPQAFMLSFLAPPTNLRNRQWAIMNENALRLTLHANHNLANMFPPSKYAETNPDIYEMRNGKRVIPSEKGTAWQPSLVAPELPDLAMDYVRARMKETPNLKYISFGMMDTPFDDQTPAAQASVKKYGDYSNLYFEFLNKVAVKVKKEYPNLLITAYSYTNAKTAPVGIRIEPNIVVDVVITSYNFVIPGNMEQTEKRIQSYSDLGAKVILHDWDFSGITPRSYLPQLATFLQWSKQHGVLGMYTEWSDGESWYLDGAKYWILMQLMSDPYQDVSLLWKQYCDDMYGAGSKPMYRLFSNFRDVFMYAPGRINFGDMPREEPTLYGPELLAYERGLIEKAQGETQNDPLAQERLAKVMHYFRAHELFAEATATPARLDREYTGDGINKPLLDFYVNDDGTKLAEAIDYYNNKLTVPPDSHKIADMLGLGTSYVNNYTRGFASLLQIIRAQALQGVDLNNVDAAKVQHIDAKAKQILHDNLPQKYLPARVAQFEDILNKALYIPRVDKMPVIDGDLSDPEWKNAAPLTGFTARDTLLPSTDTTVGKIMRVGDNLVIGITAHQKGDIWAVTPADIKTGARIWRESGCEFFFGPVDDQDKSPYAQYVVNVLGAYQGFSSASNNREGVQVAVKLDKDKGMFTMEVVFPLKTALYDYSQQKVLSFNIARDVYTRNSYESDVMLGWYPIFYTATVPQSRGIIFFGTK
ncbi:MAG: DUF4838 domain-containing protein [Abditibacteriaceae bacterium]